MILIYHFIDIYLRFSFQNKRETATWKKKDSDCQKQLNNWEDKSPCFERNIQPHEIFQLFLTDEEMERICLESTIYACLKDEHNFTTTLDKFKACVAILLVCGYTEFSR